MTLNSRAPLDDVRIIAVEQFGAGPFGSSHLAALGAEVIKIELPSAGGDVARSVPPFARGEDSLFFQTFNLNKKSVALDISKPKGRAAFEALVAESDVIYSNLRGDVPQKLGLLYDDLRHLNPRIVACSLSAFGMTGPRMAQPGYDYVIQGLAGWMSLTGEPGGPPTKTGLSLVDYAGGLVASSAILAALHAARRDGIGCDCDLSLFDVAVSMLTYPAAWWLNEGHRVERASHSAHPSLVPFQVFATNDGWIVVACAKEKFWRRLARAMGRFDLLEDDRFRDFAARNANRVDLVSELAAEFKKAGAKVWERRLRAAGVPCGPVNDLAGALEDETTLARDLIINVPHRAWGQLRLLRSPVTVGDSGQRPLTSAPALGEHTGEILRALLGYDDSQLEAVVAELSPRRTHCRDRVDRGD